MKKIFYSFIACGLIATLASCQNQDEPGTPAGGQVTTNFPEGSKPTSVTLDIPGEARTRAEDRTVLPLWGVNESSNGGLLTVRYGVYYQDGTLYYDSSSLSTLPTTTSTSMSLTVPLPADQETMKLFVWADKTGGNAYNIDWQSKKVSYAINDSERGIFKNMAQDGDAFCYWGDINVKSSSTCTLKRPFVQVNILTDEVNGNKKLAESFINTGLGADFGLYEYSNATCYLPAAWYWDSDTFDMVMFNTTEEIVPNYCIQLGQKLSFASSSDTTIKRGIINNNSKVYLGVFYVFAPRERKAWKDETSGTEMDGFTSHILNGEGDDNTSTLNIWSELPPMKANERLIIHNGNSNGGSGGGILISESNVKLNIIPDFDADNKTEITD